MSAWSEAPVLRCWRCGKRHDWTERSLDDEGLSCEPRQEDDDG